MKLSIVTVVLNDVLNVEQTIKSVISQGVDLEYIIIDGGSSDGTLKVLERHKDKIDIFISEKDSGIYDAMNKAISLASGEWVCFMNSGDMFYDKDVLKSIENELIDEIDVLYGDWEVRYTDKTRVAKADKSVKNIWKGMVFSHQSCFVKKELLQKYRFNTKNSIAADFELFYTLFKANRVFKYIPITIASVSAGGVSDIKRVESILSRYKVIDKGIFRTIYYLFLIKIEYFKGIVKKILVLKK